MALIYTDKAVLSKSENFHPAAEIDIDHPCFRMKREAVGEKSVFHWTKEQAFQMYKWYCEGWKTCEIQTEFGENISEYEFKDVIKASHYLIPADGRSKTKNLTPSQETIQEMWDAYQMEKKILASIGENKEDG